MAEQQDNGSQYNTRLSKVEVRQEAYERELQRFHTDLKELSQRQHHDMTTMSEKQDRQHEQLINMLTNFKEEIFRNMRMWFMIVGAVLTLVIASAQLYTNTDQTNSQYQQEQTNVN